jgi:hypothetical protein
MPPQLHVTQLNGLLTTCWNSQTWNSTDYSCSLSILPKRKATSTTSYIHIEILTFKWNFFVLVTVFRNSISRQPLQQTVTIYANSTSTHAHIRARTPLQFLIMGLCHAVFLGIQLQILIHGLFNTVYRPTLNKEQKRNWKHWWPNLVTTILQQTSVHLASV